MNTRLYAIELHEIGTTNNIDRFKTVAKDFSTALKKANEKANKLNKKMGEEYCEVASVTFVSEVE